MSMSMSISVGVSGYEGQRGDVYFFILNLVHITILISTAAAAAAAPPPPHSWLLYTALIFHVRVSILVL